MVDRYISLQFLRAGAAWLVVFHHYSQVYRDFEAVTVIENFFRLYGNMGVDIFFVLSGFIMALALTSRPKTAGRFAWDRVVRIVPAYWAATAILIVSTQLPIWENVQLLKLWSWQDLIYSLLFVPNQHQSGIGIFPVLTVGWTLNYEMFFYSLLALSLLIDAKRALTLAFLIVISLPLLNQFGINVGLLAGSFLLYEFAFGLLIFQLAVKMGRVHEKSSALQASLGVGCLLVALVCFKLKFQRYDMIIAAMLVLGCVCSEVFFRSLPKLVVSTFVHLGNLSYSTYLFHVPAMIFVGTWLDRSRDNDIVLTFTTITVTYLFSIISYIYIEKRLSIALNKLFSYKSKRNENLC